MASKLKEKVPVEELLIEEIEQNSDNDWEKLCDDCSSLIKKANMTEQDIDNIVEKIRKGIV